jgi:hypothetical protein
MPPKVKAATEASEKSVFMLPTLAESGGEVCRSPLRKLVRIYLQIRAIGSSDLL